METFRSIILNPRKLVNSAHEILFQSTKDKEYRSLMSSFVIDYFHPTRIAGEYFKSDVQFSDERIFVISEF